MKEQELAELNQQGFIPGPNESEQEFLNRANYCLNSRTHLEEKTFLVIGFLGLFFSR